jgi:type IV secretion system protein VirB1
MSLALGAVMALSQQCAPGIALEAIVPQVHVESHFNELAIGVNNGPKVQARSFAEAVTLATRYIQAGYSVDLGLAQFNSKNLRRLGLTIEQTFDPCTLLRAASAVLAENYSQVSPNRSGVDAINATWSLYNSGSRTRGIRNGYVGKVWKAAADLVPQMRAILGTGQLPQLGPYWAAPPRSMLHPIRRGRRRLLRQRRLSNRAGFTARRTPTLPEARNVLIACVAIAALAAPSVAMADPTNITSGLTSIETWLISAAASSRWLAG